MTREEAIKKMQAVKAYMTSGNPIWGVTEMGETFDMAIKALELEQRIIDNGYTGKEAEFRIGGRLFGIREKAQ